MSTKGINVDIITEYKGAQNVKRAQSDLANLAEGAKKLAGAFGIAFAVKEVIDFGKASVQAFATNQKQVAILDNTLKNLGKSYASLTANKFIDNLALATGKTKEELIPAFQGLLIATGDVTTAQNELQLAMNISAGTGKDLSVVQVALSKAYLGNYTGLTRLGAGLSKATLATKDMKLINQQLASTFRGDMATAADTVQGKMDRLNVAFTEAKVAIGQGLVQAFGELASSSDFNDTLTKIVKIGDDIGNLIVQIERIGKIGSMLSIKNLWLSPIGTIKDVMGLQNKNASADALKNRQYGGIYATQYQAQVAKKLAADKAVADKAALVAANKLTQAAKDKLALERASLSLKLSGSTADMQNIEIQAALQRGQTSEINNVLLLQRALLNGNADQATILSQEILKANGLAMNVDGVISSLKDAKDPFAGWPTASAAAMAQIATIQAALDALRNKTITVTVNTIQTTTAGGVTTVTAVGSPAIDTPKGGLGNAFDGVPITVTPVLPVYPDLPAGFGAFENIPASTSTASAASIPSMPSDIPSGFGGAREGAPVNIIVTASPGIIVDTTQAASTNGTSVIVNRNNPFPL